MTAPKDGKALPARLPKDQLGAGTQWAAQAPQPATLSPAPGPCSGLTPPRCLQPSLLEPGSCPQPPHVRSTPPQGHSGRPSPPPSPASPQAGPSLSPAPHHECLLPWPLGSPQAEAMATISLPAPPLCSPTGQVTNPRWNLSYVFTSKNITASSESSGTLYPHHTQLCAVASRRG